jgi:hypothetical protein
MDIWFRGRCISNRARQALSREGLYCEAAFHPLITLSYIWVPPFFVATIVRRFLPAGQLGGLARKLP